MRNLFFTALLAVAAFGTLTHRAEAIIVDPSCGPLVGCSYSILPGANQFNIDASFGPIGVGFLQNGTQIVGATLDVTSFGSLPSTGSAFLSPGPGASGVGVSWSLAAGESVSFDLMKSTPAFATSGLFTLTPATSSIGGYPLLDARLVLTAVQVAPVPIPAAALMLLSALCTFGGIERFRRRRVRKQSAIA